MHQIEYACFQNRSGYAQSAQDYILSLTNSADFDVAITLLHSSMDQLAVSSERYVKFNDLIKKKLSDSFVQIFHCLPEMQRRISRKKKTIGFATFETFHPPEHWTAILNSNDAVICPSKFNEKIFRYAGVTKPIFYIPHCIDVNLYHPGVEKAKEFKEFTFLFLGTWKKRKGWPQLLEAWLRDFDSSDNVRLVIKTDRLTMAQRAIDQIKREIGLKKDFAPISFETRVLTEVDLPKLIKSVDCLISPTLGEGFGLPGMQAMALEVPVITTNFSGCQDYALESTATLIHPRGFLMKNEMDSIPQFRDKKWAHIAWEDVSRVMRFVLENKDYVKQKAVNASTFVREEFNYAVTADKFRKMMDTL